jgi:DNA-binding NarL/FixJ family response regulator
VEWPASGQGGTRLRLLARAELRVTGLRTQSPATAALSALSAQELQIARPAAQGLSDREIGQRLYLSHRTVGSHLYRILPKLGVSSRTELVSWLYGAQWHEGAQWIR